MMVYRGCPAVTVSPAATSTSCTVPPAVRVMAADSLAMAFPLPLTLLWMEPKETGSDWISLSTLFCLDQKLVEKYAAHGQSRHHNQGNNHIPGLSGAALFGRELFVWSGGGWVPRGALLLGLLTSISGILVSS